MSLTDHHLELNTIGPYRIIERIGSGGFGVVFKVLPVNQATQGGRLNSQNGCDVASQAGSALENAFLALKIIHPWTLDSAAYRRFLTEQQALQRIDHPHVVRFVDAGVHDGLPYMVMHYINGQPLDQVLRDDKGTIDCSRIPLATRIQWFRMICDGVAAAHQQLILHRDLKPSNILIDREGKAIVTDFGLAKSVSAQGAVSLLTSKGHLMGTLPFMSPEQIRGEASLQLSSDVYGLGALFYFLLTGQPPHDCSTISELIQAVTDSEPARLRKMDSTIPRDLETICLHCLHPSPRRRYSSAERLHDDLDHFFNGFPIKARPVRRIGRFLYWTQRQPVVAVLSASFLLATTAGLIAFAWLWAEAATSRNEANRKSQQLLDTIRHLTQHVNTAELDPATLHIQCNLLKTITAAYDSLAEDGPLDHNMLHDAGVAWFKLGRVENQTGDLIAKKRAYERSEYYFRLIAKAESSDLNDLFDLFHSITSQERLDEALVIIRDIVDRDRSGSLIYRDALSDTLRKLSWSKIQEGSYEEAWELVSQGYAIAEQLVDIDPSNKLFHRKVGQQLLLHGNLAEHRSGMDEPLVYIEKAIGYLTTAYEMDTLDLGICNDVISANIFAVNVALETGRHEKARHWLEIVEAFSQDALSAFNGYESHWQCYEMILCCRMLFELETMNQVGFDQALSAYRRLISSRLKVVPHCSLALQKIEWLDTGHLSPRIDSSMMKPSCESLP